MNALAIKRLQNLARVRVLVADRGIVEGDCEQNKILVKSSKTREGSI